MQGEVTLDLSNGNSLGLTFRKDPTTGTGARVKDIKQGGQADGLGVIVPDSEVLRINGENVTALTMKEIGRIIKSQDQCTILFAQLAYRSSMVRATPRPPTTRQPHQYHPPPPPQPARLARLAPLGCFAGAGGAACRGCRADWVHVLLI